MAGTTNRYTLNLVRIRRKQIYFARAKSITLVSALGVLAGMFSGRWVK